MELNSCSDLLFIVILLRQKYNWNIKSFTVLCEQKIIILDHSHLKGKHLCFFVSNSFPMDPESWVCNPILQLRCFHGTREWCCNHAASCRSWAGYWRLSKNIDKKHVKVATCGNVVTCNGSLSWTTKYKSNPRSPWGFYRWYWITTILVLWSFEVINSNRTPRSKISSAPVRLKG